MTRPPHSVLSAITVALAVLSGCAPENKFEAPPPPEVDVRKPLVEDTTIWLEFPGRTQAFQRVEIRARVQGFLQSREFQPGQFVKKDQVLFKIEPERYRNMIGQSFRQVVDFGQPLCHHISYLHHQNLVSYEQLILPFSRTGSDVEVLVEALDWLPGVQHDLKCMAGLAISASA